MLGELLGVDDAFELYFGVARGADWPRDAYCEMAREYPKDIALSDSPAGAGVLVVSQLIRDALIETGVNNCEFLCLTIINHKGRVAADDYYIVNPLDRCDCIDVQASAGRFNLIDPDSLYRCDRLVLTPYAIPDSHVIFRPKNWPDVVLLRRSVAESLSAAGFSGLRFVEPDDYTGLT